MITYDWPTSSERPAEPPGPGDTLVCLSRRRPGRPTGTAYLILTAHEVRRVEPMPGEIRMRYTVARVTLAEAVRAPRWEPLVWTR